MSKPNTNTITIPVKILPGISLPAEALNRAQVAAQAVVDAATSAQALDALLQKLERKGFSVTPAQWAALQGDGSARGGRTRIVLTAAQRKQVTKRCKEGATGAQIVQEFGISLATVNNIKKSEGISKPRKARKGRR
ncbi:MAG: hypothetical protein ACKO2G_15330 [Verrucomicrobiales bacterium]